MNKCLILFWKKRKMNKTFCHHFVYIYIDECKRNKINMFSCEICISSSDFFLFPSNLKPFFFSSLRRDETICFFITFNNFILFWVSCRFLCVHKLCNYANDVQTIFFLKKLHEHLTKKKSSVTYDNFAHILLQLTSYAK